MTVSIGPYGTKIKNGGHIGHCIPIFFGDMDFLTCLNKGNQKIAKKLGCGGGAPLPPPSPCTIMSVVKRYTHDISGHREVT